MMTWMTKHIKLWLKYSVHSKCTPLLQNPRENTEFYIGCSCQSSHAVWYNTGDKLPLSCCRCLWYCFYGEIAMDQSGAWYIALIPWSPWIYCALGIGLFSAINPGECGITITYLCTLYYECMPKSSKIFVLEYFCKCVHRSNKEFWKFDLRCHQNQSQRLNFQKFSWGSMHAPRPP